MSLKIKTVASLIKKMWPITLTSLLKKNLTYASVFKAYFMNVFGSVKASLVLIKNRCRSSRSQMFFKSSHLRCFIKKAALKNFPTFTGKHFCWGLFLIKLQAFMCFPMNIAKFLWETFFIEHLGWLLLQYSVLRYIFKKTLLNIL